MLYLQFQMLFAIRSWYRYLPIISGALAPSTGTCYVGYHPSCCKIPCLHHELFYGEFPEIDKDPRNVFTWAMSDTCPERPGQTEQHPSESGQRFWTGSIGSTVRGRADWTGQNHCKLWCAAHMYVYVTSCNHDFWSSMFNKCATAIKCMLFLHNIQHVCSLDCNTARFLSGTCIFHSETQYRTAVQELCSGLNPSIALVSLPAGGWAKLTIFKVLNYYITLSVFITRIHIHISAARLHTHAAHLHTHSWTLTLLTIKYAMQLVLIRKVFPTFWRESVEQWASAHTRSVYAHENN
jgi:hypothetical protein